MVLIWHDFHLTPSNANMRECVIAICGGTILIWHGLSKQWRRKSQKCISPLSHPPLAGLRNFPVFPRIFNTRFCILCEWVHTIQNTEYTDGHLHKHFLADHRRDHLALQTHETSLFPSNFKWPNDFLTPPLQRKTQHWVKIIQLWNTRVGFERAKLFLSFFKILQLLTLFLDSTTHSRTWVSFQISFETWMLRSPSCNCTMYNVDTTYVYIFHTI